MEKEDHFVVATPFLLTKQAAMPTVVILQLSNFNDFFATFGTFNLGYATLEIFREIINDDILKITVNLDGKTKKAEEDLSSLASINKYEEQYPIIVKAFENLKDKFEDTRSSITDRANVASEISEGSKSMFLYTGLYCLSFTIISGYQDALKDLTNIFMTLINLSFFFNLVIFIKSFTKYKVQKAKPVWTIFTFAVILFLTTTICHFLPDEIKLHFSTLNVNIILSVIIALSPFLFHVVRLFFVKKQYQPQIDRSEIEYIYQLEALRALLPIIFSSNFQKGN